MTLLLVLAAAVRPDQSPAMGRVVADVSADDASRLAVSVRAPRDSKKVTFYFDAQQRWVDRSPKWQFGPRGYLEAGSIEPGRHLLTSKVALRSGRVKRASRVVFLTSSVGTNGSRWRVQGPTKDSGLSEPTQLQAADVEADFERGFAGWNMDGVGDVKPTIASDAARSGKSSGKVILTGTQERSELILDGSGGTGGSGAIRFHEGDEHYYGFSFLIKSMQYGEPGAHNLITQFKSDGDGSPNFGLQLWDYAGDGGDDGGKGLWSHGDAMGGDRFLAPIPHNQWNDVVIHFKASGTGRGFYEIFLNGELVDSRQNVSMIVPKDEYAYLKTGLYRNGGEIPGTSEMRLDDARLGTSMGQVQIP